MQVRRLKIFPIESIVRGYITGSAWKEYQQKGTVHGMAVKGISGGTLKESERFDQPLWTPSTKVFSSCFRFPLPLTWLDVMQAEAGANDENIHPDQAAKIVGANYAKRIEQLSLEIYEKVGTPSSTALTDSG
jgi:phosphoribosylaminoimidazole-succinocarboxamide synthase